MILHNVNIHRSFQISKSDERVRVQKRHARYVFIQNEVSLKESFLKIPYATLWSSGGGGNQHHRIAVTSKYQVLRMTVLDVSQNVSSLVDRLEVFGVVVDLNGTLPA